MKQRSLTRRLIGSVLLAEFICAAIFSAVAIGHEAHGRQHGFDVMLRGRTDSLLGAVQDADDPEANVSVDPTELVLPAEDIYAVSNPSGRLLGASPNATAQILAALSSSSKDGFRNIEIDGVSYRVLRTQGVRVIDRLENGGRRRPVTLIYAAPTGHLLHEVFEGVRFYMLSSALLLAVTGLSLALLLRRWLAPLHQLAESAARVSVSSWEFDPPVAALRTRELRPIASSIGQLLQGLQAAFERQRRFIGDAAHELKTSLALLKSSLQLLTLRHRTAEEYEQGLNDLTADVRRMEDLTEQMLTLARIEEERPDDLAPVTDVAEVLGAVGERLRSFAEARQVSICIEAGMPYPVRIQPEGADVLISNLLMNAVQHSPEMSQVTASIGRQSSTVELRIVDHGEGIRAEALPHLFERFYRTDASRSRKTGGTGLGLAIGKAIVDRALGTIAVQSSPGSGTEVIVTLPLA